MVRHEPTFVLLSGFLNRKDATPAKQGQAFAKKTKIINLFRRLSFDGLF
jgi:hypothetical protein